MKTCALVLIGAAACGGSTVRREREPPPVKLALGDGGSVHIVDVTATGATIVRTVQTPGQSVDVLLWTAGGPVVQLDLPLPSLGEYSAPPPTSHANEIGEITDHGYVTIPMPPVSTWAVAKDSGPPIEPMNELEVDDHGALWMKHCDWGYSPDHGDHCSTPVYARLLPTPLVATLAAPTPRTRWQPPQLAAPTTPVITIAEHDGATSVTCDEQVLVKLDGSRTFEKWWLSIDPPIFALTEIIDKDGFEDTKIFEGCVGSTSFNGYVAGPDGLVALLGVGRVRILRGGKLLVELHQGASRAAFAAP